MYQSLIVESLQQLCGAIRRVIVHHDDVELEVGFLRQGAVHGITDGLLTIEDGNHHRGLDIKLLFVEVWPTIVGRVDLSTDLVQMCRSGLLHLDLHLTVAWVHVVELLHARGTGVEFFFRIEFLIDMEQFAAAAQEEAQGIEACMAVVALAGLHGKRMEQCCLDEQQRSEVEVIADAAQLVVDDGVGHTLAADEVEVVGIDHRCIAVGGHSENPL